MLGNQASSQQCHGQENVTLLALFVSPPSFLKPRCTASFVYLDSLPPSPSPPLYLCFLLISFVAFVLYFRMLPILLDKFRIKEIQASYNESSSMFVLIFHFLFISFRIQRYEYRNVRHQSFNLYILLIVLVIKTYFAIMIIRKSKIGV